MPSELWTHMAAEHGVHLLDSEEADLVAAVERDRAVRQSRMGDTFLAEIARTQTLVAHAAARDLGLQVAAENVELDEATWTLARERVFNGPTPAPLPPHAGAAERWVTEQRELQMRALAESVIADVRRDLEGWAIAAPAAGREGSGFAFDPGTGAVAFRGTATWNGIPLGLAASEDDFFGRQKPAPPSGRRFDIARPDGRLV